MSNEEPKKNESLGNNILNKIRINSARLAMLCITTITLLSLWFGFDSVALGIASLAGLGGYEVGKQSND